MQSIIKCGVTACRSCCFELHTSASVCGFRMHRTAYRRSVAEFSHSCHRLAGRGYSVGLARATLVERRAVRRHQLHDQRRLMVTEHALGGWSQIFALIIIQSCHSGTRARRRCGEVAATSKRKRTGGWPVLHFLRLAARAVRRPCGVRRWRPGSTSAG